MSLAQIFGHAATIIADPHNWTKGTYARDPKGVPICYSADEATCFCTLGAIRRATHELRQPELCPQAEDFIERIMEDEIGRCIANFNDFQAKHEDVLDLLRHAQREAKEMNL